MKRIIILLITLALISQLSAQNFKLSVLSGNIENINLLVDGNVNTGWFPGWNSADYPVQVLIEFDTAVFVKNVRFYDNVGQPNLTFFHLKEQEKLKLFKTSLNSYQQWRSVDVSYNIPVRYLLFEIDAIQGDLPINELQFLVSLTNDNPNPTPLTKLKGDALKLGVNGFHWVPAALNPTSNLRMYQMAQWTWTPTGISVQPSFQANANYDDYLLENKNKNTIFCINKIPDWFADQSVGAEWADQRFHKYGVDAELPNSYLKFSEYAWQMVARYGSKQYPSNLLKVNKIPRWNGDEVNTEKSGLNLIKYIEFENEPDRPWKENPLYKYTPQQMAALMSALWDGHEKSMGTYVGVKNADPKIKMVLPGLSNIDIVYLNKMKQWFDQNRTDKQFCADVINVHHYSNTKNPFPEHYIDLTGAGTNPEADHLEYRLSEFNMWCRQNLPKCEVWYSEFGYDTELPSTILSQYPQVYGNKTAEYLQGQWLLRIYLISLSCGMDKIFMYNLCDENSASAGYIFGSSGLLTSEITEYKKKQSWNDINWLVRELNGYKFYKNKSIDGVTILEFRNQVKSKFFYWTPDNTTNQFKIGPKVLTANDSVQTYRKDIFFVGNVVTDIIDVDHN